MRHAPAKVRASAPVPARRAGRVLAVAGGPRSAASSALVLLGLLATVRSAAAQAPETPLPTDATLTRLLAQSLAARPELAQSVALVHAEEARVSQVAALPDPTLQLGVQNDGFTSVELGRMDTSFVSLMASQTFPWPGKRGLRQALATLGAARAKQAVARLRLATEAEVRRDYLELLLLRDRRALLDRLEALGQTARGAAQARYEAGAGAQSELLRAQLELNRLRQRRWLLAAEERGRVQALNRWRAHPLEEPIATAAGLRQLPALASWASRFSAQRALERSPELAAARLELERTRRAVALAQTSYYPDLTVGAGLMIRGKLPPMWLLNVGGPLPLFAASKQRRAVTESRARASAAQQEVAALEQLLRLRSAQRQTAFSALLQTLALYQQGLLVQSEATTLSTFAQYQVGKASLASVLEANTGFLADQEGYLQAIAAGHRLLIAEAEVSLVATSWSASGTAASAGGTDDQPFATLDAPGEARAPAGASPSATGGSMSGM